MKKRASVCAVLFVFVICIPSTILALGEGQFKPLATGGFGDSANSYAWGMIKFKNDLYVSTNRHHLWSLLQSFGGLLGGDLSFENLVEGPSNPQWGSYGYASEMLGGIWRMRNGHWQKVYESDIINLPQVSLPQYNLTIPAGQYPKAYGYRTLGTFKGYIYALGVGTWMPPLPFSSIVRSATGDPGDWENVTGALANTTNVRGFVEWRDKVYVSASVPGDQLASSGGCVVFGSANGAAWAQVSEIGFGNLENAEIYDLAVFNDHLYASTVNYVTGFEVWKSDGSEVNGKLIWTRVVKDGFGDTWNQYGMTMRAFGNYLYVGSAVGIGMVLKDGQPAGTRALDIIRIDKNDYAELVVGAYFPVDPPPGWPTVRVPLSFIPAGFGNPFNVYTWSMEVFRGWLVVGTLDISGTVLRYAKELLLSDPDAAMTLLQNIDPGGLSPAPQELLILKKFNFKDPEHIEAATQLLDFIIENYGGADLWKTKDGKSWEPVTLSGFENPLNYGIRRALAVTDARGGKEQLYIGTANPFTGEPGGGCEVLVSSPVK
jgi:hypothetical protein